MNDNRLTKKILNIWKNVQWERLVKRSKETSNKALQGPVKQYGVQEKPYNRRQQKHRKRKKSTGKYWTDENKKQHSECMRGF